jgi:SulP family sulfate permease
VAAPQLSNTSAPPPVLQRFIPALGWLVRYDRRDLPADLLAGLIVAIMLVPQGMAYALLAGLPPQVGLYAGILPLLIYGLLGTSRVLAVGPVAIVSLLVATSLQPLAAPGSAAYLQLALLLALLSGLLQILLGLLRAGFLVNFLSHPVLGGFTSAAAIVIGFSQIGNLLGFKVPGADYFLLEVAYTLSHLNQTNPVTLAIGLSALLYMLWCSRRLGPLLRRRGVDERWITPLTRSAPLQVVVFSTLAVMLLGLDERFGVAIVGVVPAGLPPLTMPAFDPALWAALLPAALLISLIGYVESISVAKSLGAKRREKVDSNQELIALGAASVGAALSGGYPVTGGFSRSVVNFSAGARTGLASMITAVLVALTVLFLTPAFTYLPKTVLAAIIIVAVLGLVDLRRFRHLWAFSKGDALSFLVTFVAVLALGIEWGLLLGVATAVGIYLWRSSHPHMALVGRLGETQLYLNVLRHEVKTCATAVCLRVDESLYFANTKALEDAVQALVADQPQVTHLVLLASSVNAIDASALETLEALHEELREAGVELHFAALKDIIYEKLARAGFVDIVGAERFHASMFLAMQAVGCEE